MTAKRFTYEYDEYNGNLFDNKMNTFYHIEDSDENIEVLCDRLNWLVEENEQLKANYNSLSHNNGLLYDECSNKINALKKENEQLQKQIEELKVDLKMVKIDGAIDRMAQRPMRW